LTGGPGLRRDDDDIGEAAPPHLNPGEMDSSTQLSLLEEPARALAEGFEYRPELVSLDQQAELIERFRALDFKPFEFHGYFGNRRVVSFGWHYDFAASRVRPAADIPDFLLPLRDRAAAFARLAPAQLEHALVTEYAPGAGIGWHRDRPVFDDVIGISLGAPCRFRLRKKRGDGWERAAIELMPRSAYLLRGPVRREWEHSISPLDRLRYSVTFRSKAPAKGADQ
jgi:alkylated DNA repair dioxygenase AlkB